MTAYDDAVLADNPVAYWKLDEEGVPSQFDDSSGNGLHLTVISGTSVGDPLFDNAERSRIFDGVDDWLRTAINAMPAIDGDATVECWAEVDDLNDDRTMVGADDPSDELRFRHSADGTFRMSVGGSLLDTSETHVVGSPHHVVAVWDSSEGEARFYVDGTLFATVSGSVSFSDVTYTQVIGARRVSPSNLFKGRLSHCARYDTSLSPARIQAHYDAAFESIDLTNAYLIFRRTPSTGEPFDPEVDTPIATVPPEQLTYDDEDLAEGEYDWQVFARKVPEPSGPLTFEDDWNLNDSDPWNPNKWNVTGVGITDVQGSQGRMVPGSDFSQAVALHTPSEYCNILVKVRFDSTSGGWAGITVLGDGEFSDTGPDRRSLARNGYTLHIAANNPTVFLRDMVDGVHTSIGTFSWTQGTDEWLVRIVAEGTAVRVRVWLSTDPEPETWNLDVVNIPHTAGVVQLAYANGSNIVFWDDLVAQLEAS